MKLHSFQLVDLAPCTLEEMRQVAHRGPPLGRQALRAFAIEGKPPVERRAQVKVLQIQHAGGETATEPLRAAVDDYSRTCPDGLPFHEQLEGVQ